MALTRRRGQFFVIGALLIASLITGYVVLDVGGIQPPQTQTPRQLFDRATTEFPEAINHITGTDPSAEAMQRRLTSYLAFQQDRFAAHGLQTQAHALIGVPAGVNFTVAFANFRGQNATNVQITVDGTTKTVGTVVDGSTALATFADVPDSTSIHVSFQTGQAVTQQYRASTNRRSALLYLRVQGQDQTWVDTRTY